MPCRLALENRRPQTNAPGFAEHLEETAQEEVDMSFLDGPYHSAAEVTDALGHPNWRIVRRFVIEQGAKLRPIDDGLEAQLNSAYTSTIRLDLQDADYVIALTLELGKTRGLNRVGKTLDLSKAYKQLPIRPSHRDLAVVFFRDKEGKARYYIPNALMFGSTVAVYAFNRFSRSIWFLINVLLKVPSAVYFDDYPMFAPEQAAPETDVLVSDFLDLLGWRHDRTGPKGKPFVPSFDVLGMTLDLADLQRAGIVTLKNKEGRVEKIASKISGIQQEGTMSLAEAQELHGLLNFATGYFAGRSLKYACFKIFSLVDKGKFQSKSLKEWCEEVLVLLQSVQPRTIPITIDTKTALVFTDGAWENGVGGMGAVLIDESTGSNLVVQDEVHESLLTLWKEIVGEQLICQIELLAMVLVRWQWMRELHNHRVLLFVDNNSARGGTIKGRSTSPSMDDLVKAFYSIEVHLPSFWWIERPLVGRWASSRQVGGPFHQRIPMPAPSSGMAGTSCKERSRSGNHKSVLNKGEDGNRTIPTWLGNRTIPNWPPNRWMPIGRLGPTVCRHQTRYPNLNRRYFPRSGRKRYAAGCSWPFVDVNKWSDGKNQSG